MEHEYRNIAIVIPSLNPDEHLPSTVNAFIDEGFLNIIVVDDGSDAKHQLPFQQVKALPFVHLLVHDVNHGKGRAMKTAFSYIIEQKLSVDGVITVDSDGQHLPKDVIACSKELLAHPDHVILGVRDFHSDLVPARSRFGNRCTSLVFLLCCGLKISDTQTGLRAFPIRYLPLLLEIDGERYEYETEMLLVLNRSKIPFREVTIDTVYINKNEASHFHPIRDSFRIYKIILKFLLSSIVSFIVDYGIFTLIIALAGSSSNRGIRLLAATVIARVISSLVNFTCNRKFVFHSEEHLGKTMLRYYALCLVQMGASYGLVYLFSSLLNAQGLWESLIKFCVDMVLFFLSFQIQRSFVFGNRRPPENEIQP